jgi:hypothetical protein
MKTNIHGEFKFIQKRFNDSILEPCEICLVPQKHCCASDFFNVTSTDGNHNISAHLICKSDVHENINIILCMSEATVKITKNSEQCPTCFFLMLSLSEITRTFKIDLHKNKVHKCLIPNNPASELAPKTWSCKLLNR